MIELNQIEIDIVSGAYSWSEFGSDAHTAYKKFVEMMQTDVGGPGS